MSSTRKKIARPSPEAFVLRTWKVGFGDCFLLTFEYGGTTGDRHVLIDFGSMKYPKDAKSGHMTRVLKMIRDETKTAEHPGGKLHAIVATHRHKDHISGFGYSSAFTILKDMAPDIVIQPWTEDPELDEDATEPAKLEGNEAHRFSLSQMNAFSVLFFDGKAAGALQHLKSVDSKKFEIMSFSGMNNISNRKSVENLIELGKMGRAVYAHAGLDLKLGDILPGVEVDVIGPPTVTQYEGVTKQTHDHETEFWHMHALAAESTGRGKADPFPDHKGIKIPVEADWAVYRLKKLRLGMLHQIVRALDRALNNTSLILLFRAGNKSFLFPGDAQLENWEYAMQDQDVMAKLAEVDLYKVGHHGSLNATPKTVWKNFDKKSETGGGSRMTSVLSTLSGKHGSVENESEVPRSKLVSALKKESDLVNTEEFDEDEFCRMVRFDLT